jgi:hypothetical protein
MYHVLFIVKMLLIITRVSIQFQINLWSRAISSVFAVRLPFQLGGCLVGEKVWVRLL